MTKKIIKKDDDFLSQIPDWEVEYKSSNDAVIDFEKQEWKSAKATFTDHDLRILGEPVMEDWETPYMKVLADIACEKGGIILELGFGMAISANFIQENSISKHIIIEANHEVAEEARKFGKVAKHEVQVLEGLWEEVIEQVPDESLDGILFDTYPLSDKELYQNHFFFFSFAFKKLKNGGIFTYYSDEERDFGRVHLEKLAEAGFKTENISGTVVNVDTPKDCEYWKADTFLAPKIIK
jgi:guanidinoacetate N-methyltransferase